MDAEVTTDKQGHTLRVMVGGAVVKTFDEVSDDYAFTNRDAYVTALKRALPSCATLHEAADRAWHDM